MLQYVHGVIFSLLIFRCFLRCTTVASYRIQRLTPNIALLSSQGHHGVSALCIPCFYAIQEEFDKDLIPLEESFKPLVLKCKELGRAMRIGTNHGSLSARVLSYYGDTPRGMVESAVEFANICRWVVGPAS